jgi:hypothetical protein
MAMPARAQGTAGGDTTGRPPKVVVVVAGDPDADLREAAAWLDERIARTPSLRAPVDPGLRRALRGAPAPSEDDGLGRARAARRRLGWGETKDLPVLLEIGRMAGADAVVVVRSGPAHPRVVVVDAKAGAFFEGELAWPEDRGRALRFVQSRATAAQGRDASRTPTPERAATSAQQAGSRDHGALAPDDEGGRTSDPTASDPKASDPKARDGNPSDRKDDEATGARAWFKDNWPYIVAGALLAGTVAFFLLRDDGGGSAQPRFRFVPPSE